MVTGGPVVAAAGVAKAGIPALGYVLLVIILSWALLFAVLLAYAAVLFTARGNGQRRRQASRGAAMPRRASQPAGLDALRRADPGFDEQLLLDAAQTATMLVFAATSTGDEAPISRLVTESFWQTPFGVLTRTTARDRRRENEQAAKDAAQGQRSRRWTVPLDYQASVPELVAVRLGARQQVTVRVWFDQLQAILRPGAGDFAAGAAATSFAAAMVSVGKAVAADRNSRRAGQANGVSWLAAGGRYDLTFVRPADARTDPSAALADRTCTNCGATYMSELATACEHCSTPRPLPWGQWWLTEAIPVA
jgi:hypothetical protein